MNCSFSVLDLVKARKCVPPAVNFEFGWGKLRWSWRGGHRFIVEVRGGVFSRRSDKIRVNGLGIRGVLGVGPREHLRLLSSTGFGPSGAGEQRAIRVGENV